MNEDSPVFYVYLNVLSNVQQYLYNLVVDVFDIETIFVMIIERRRDDTEIQVRIESKRNESVKRTNFVRYENRTSKIREKSTIHHLDWNIAIY